MHNECLIETKRIMYVLKYKDAVCELILWALKMLQLFLFITSLEFVPQKLLITSGISHFLSILATISLLSTVIGLKGTFSLGVKQLDCDANFSSSSSAKIRDLWSYASTPPYMAMCLIKHRCNASFIRQEPFSLKECYVTQCAHRAMLLYIFGIFCS